MPATRHAVRDTLTFRTALVLGLELRIKAGMGYASVLGAILVAFRDV